MTRGRKKDEFDPCLIVATLRITPILPAPPLPRLSALRPFGSPSLVYPPWPFPAPRACVVDAALPSLRAALYSTLAST
jgi:hypothetical protein